MVRRIISFILKIALVFALVQKSGLLNFFEEDFGPVLQAVLRRPRNFIPDCCETAGCILQGLLKKESEGRVSNNRQQTIGAVCWWYFLLWIIYDPRIHLRGWKRWHTRHICSHTANKGLWWVNAFQIFAPIAGIDGIEQYLPSNFDWQTLPGCEGCIYYPSSVRAIRHSFTSWRGIVLWFSYPR